MKPVFRRKYIANMCVVNADSASTSALVTRIGLVAALCECALLAPNTYGGTMKASVFEKWFEDELLSSLLKDHVIIVDNASFHKKESLQNLAGKYSQTLIFFCRRIRRNSILLNTRGAL